LATFGEVVARIREDLNRGSDADARIKRAIADASAAGSHDIAALHHAVGDRWRHSALTRPAIERIDTQLREAARAWRAAAPGQALEFRWPG